MKSYDPPDLMNQQQCHIFFARLQAQNPHPTTELNYSTPFELLIAVILSAQATDKSVNQATASLFPVANTPTAILALGKSRFKEHIKTIGLYNNKTEFIFQTCQQLLEKHQGKIPNERSALQALPGVGRKTANVVLNTLFGHPTIAVDTHVFRVANRTGLAPGKTESAVEAMLLKQVPEQYQKNAHHWLIQHGRYTCRALQPQCRNCTIEDICLYSKKNLAYKVKSE